MILVVLAIVALLIAGYVWHSTYTVDIDHWRWRAQRAEAMLAHPCNGPRRVRIGGNR